MKGFFFSNDFILASPQGFIFFTPFAAKPHQGCVVINIVRLKKQNIQWCFFMLIEQNGAIQSSPFENSRRVGHYVECTTGTDEKHGLANIACVKTESSSEPCALEDRVFLNVFFCLIGILLYLYNMLQSQFYTPARHGVPATGFIQSRISNIQVRLSKGKGGAQKRCSTTVGKKTSRKSSYVPGKYF